MEKVSGPFLGTSHKKGPDTFFSPDVGILVADRRDLFRVEPVDRIPFRDRRSSPRAVRIDRFLNAVAEDIILLREQTS